MKSENNIKKFFDKAAIDTNPKSDKTVLNRIIAAQTKTNIWRLIMKSPITKLAAAVVFIAGVFILFVYSSKGNNSPKNIDVQIALPVDINKTELPISDDKLDEDLMLAKQLFEDNDISGLSKLLNNEFKPVQFKAAQYLGQIGDKSVLPQLQLLASQWKGLEEENVFEKAIFNINNRLTESVVKVNDIPNVTSSNTIEKNTRQSANDKIINETVPMGFQGLPDDQNDEAPREREPILFGSVIDIQGNPITDVQVFASYAESGRTNKDGKFELLIPRTDGSGTAGSADFPIYVWAFKDDPYKVAWTLIRDTELEKGLKIEETHQGVKLKIEDENDLFQNIPGVPGKLSHKTNNNLIVKDIILIMGQAGVISGQIKNVDGQPVSGAIVRADQLNMKLGLNELIVNNFEPVWKPGPECMTDDHGYYILTNIPSCWKEVTLTVTSSNLIKHSEIVIKSSEDTVKNIQFTEADLHLNNALSYD